MRLPASLFLAVAVVIAAAWWWLGSPVAMPASPLEAGEKLYCLSYAPFRGAQSPLDPTTQIDRGQIEEDLRRLSGLTDCVRTYSTQNGLDQVPEIAARHGLKVLLGIWLGGSAEFTRRDIEVATALAKKFPETMRAVVVGNEVLLRGEMTAADLAATIRRVKAAVPVPVTYADVWEFWLRNPAVYEAVDFVTIHILPYWEDFPIPAASASDHVSAIRQRVTSAFPDKEVLLGEVGWPSAGRMREAALPSPAGQARVLHDVLTLAKRENFRVNLIEAFDQPWKRQLEGTVGGHWGLLDASSRTTKFAWGMPVSNHPHWALQAAGGIAFAALVFAAAYFSRRGRNNGDEQSPRVWLSIAMMALGPGILIGWTIENVPLESLGIGGWTRSIAFAAVALASPIVCAAMRVRDVPLPGFAGVLGGVPAGDGNWLRRAGGFLLVALTVLALQVALGLVFDPRYRDFPFAPLTSATLPFVVLLAPRFRTWRVSAGAAEKLAALTLGLSILYIVPNETFANWQSLWLCAALAALALTLLRLRAAPD